jgi:hypothetical protein
MPVLCPSGRMAGHQPPKVRGGQPPSHARGRCSLEHISQYEKHSRAGVSR